MTNNQDSQELDKPLEQSAVPAKRSSRRRFIKAGAAVAGGIVLGGSYVKPMLLSVSMASVVAQAYGEQPTPTTPPPPPPTSTPTSTPTPTGQGSVDLMKTIDSVNFTTQGDLMSGTITGIVTIKNVSDSPVDVRVSWINDYVTYRLKGSTVWLPLTTITPPSFYNDTLSVNDVIPASATKTCHYTIPFSDLPAGATALNNTFQIRLVARDHTFSTSASAEMTPPGEELRIGRRVNE